MTPRGEPSSQPAGTVTSAHASALEVARLREARAQALQRELMLAQELAQEEALTQPLERTKARAVARVLAGMQELARQQSPPTLAQLQELSREARRDTEVWPQLEWAEVRIEALAEAQARAQAQVQELERALALAMAQARTLARAQAQARSPRMRAIGLVRLLWQLIRAPRGAWAGLVRNLYLGMGIVALLVWMLPTAARARWKHEAYVELEMLKQEEAPLLGNAIRIALRTPLLALVLRTRAWDHSAGRWVARREPLWIGLGSAVAAFLTGAAGISGQDQPPSAGQLWLLVVASLVAGVLATWQARKKRRPPRRKR